MRESCLECVLKHIGKAAVLIHELKDYPFHYIYVIGNLSEAEDECEQDYPELRNMIYEVRKAFMREEDIDMDTLTNYIYNLWKESHE